jgi:hypothetical protein
LICAMTRPELPLSERFRPLAGAPARKGFDFYETRNISKANLLSRS